MHVIRNPCDIEVWQQSSCYVARGKHGGTKSRAGALSTSKRKKNFRSFPDQLPPEPNTIRTRGTSPVATVVSRIAHPFSSHLTAGLSGIMLQNKNKQSRGRGANSDARHATKKRLRRVPMDHEQEIWVELDADPSREPDNFDSDEDRQIARQYCANNAPHRAKRRRIIERQKQIWDELDGDLAKQPKDYDDDEDRKIATSYIQNNVTYKSLKDKATTTHRGGEAKDGAVCETDFICGPQSFDEPDSILDDTTTIPPSPTHPESVQEIMVDIANLSRDAKQEHRNNTVPMSTIVRSLRERYQTTSVRIIVTNSALTSLKRLKDQQSHLLDSWTTSGDDLTLHSHAVLTELIAAHENIHDGTNEQGSLTIFDSPVTWSHHSSWGEKKEFMSQSAIDALMMATQERHAHTAYMPTDHPLYARCFGHIANGTPATAVEAAFTRMAAEGKTARHDPNLPPNTTTLVMPLNLTGNHWFFIVASRLTDNIRQITFYDSMASGCQVAPDEDRTVRRFMELIGEYHESFQGPWDTDATYGNTVTQITHDCGPICVWGMRRILAGRTTDVILKDAIGFGIALRTLGMRELYTIITEGPKENLARIQNEVLSMPREADQVKIVSLKDDYTPYLKQLSARLALEAVFTTLRTSRPHSWTQMKIVEFDYLFRAGTKAIGVAINDKTSFSQMNKYDLLSTIAFNSSLQLRSNTFATIRNIQLIPELALDLFSDDRHRYCNEDDIRREYDLVIVAVRSSGASPTESYKNVAQAKEDEGLKLYATWATIFDRVPKRTEVRSPSQMTMR